MTKKTKPAAKPKVPPPLPLKYRRWTPEELRDIVELAQTLRPKKRRLKVETVPFGMDDLKKKTKPAEPQKSSLLKGCRWTPEELQELRDIVELAQALRPKERRYKVVTVPFGMDD